VVVALESRLVVLRETREGVRTRTFVGADLSGASTSLVTPPSGLVGPAPFAATRLRDAVIVARVDRGHVATVVFDPFADAVVAGPRRVASTDASECFGIAADDLGGTAGICFRAGSETPAGIDFVLVGPDGAALGAPVALARGLFNPSGCAVGVADVDRYVVVVWDAVADGVASNILAMTVTVRR
jgi:hypothetical protein